MAWWQMLSISLVSGLGVGSLFGIGWWFWKRALRAKARTIEEQRSSSAGAGERPEEKQVTRAQAALFSRQIQEIIALYSEGLVPPEKLAQTIKEAATTLLSSTPVLEDQAELEEKEQPSEPFVLKELGSLTLRCLLGCGGFGRVQLVEDPEGLFAWKASDKRLLEKSAMTSNVVDEKRVLGVTQICPSPFIVKYYGCCHTRKYLYFKLEALLGGELYRTYNKKSLYGSEEHARYYMACAFQGIQHLHELRVMLRSLKPEDCALDERGCLKIIDFGLSKFLVNKTFTTCGTPDYFSPEIISSEGHSFPVDWWCAGVMLFELLSGKPPFEAAYPMQIYQRVMKGINRVPWPKAIPATAKDLIYSLLRPNPQNRLPEAKGFGALQKHAFFQKLDWSNLASMAPPYVPGSSYQENFSASQMDLHQCFTQDLDKSWSPRFDWSVHFGEMMPMDDLPHARFEDKAHNRS